MHVASSRERTFGRGTKRAKSQHNGIVITKNIGANVKAYTHFQKRMLQKSFGDEVAMTSPVPTIAAGAKNGLEQRACGLIRSDLVTLYPNV